MSRRQKCTAHRSSTKEPCGNWARIGYNVCRFHGAGNKAKPGGAPIKHGRYSRIQSPRIQELYQEFLSDPEPLDLHDELAMLRALVQDFIDRYDAFSAALLAWHSSFGKADGSEKPRALLDISDAADILSDIGRMVERIEAIRAGGTVTQRDFALLLRRMAEVVWHNVPDETTRKTIQSAWDSIV